jgi:hypothetical protein
VAELVGQLPGLVMQEVALLVLFMELAVLAVRA